MGELSASEVVAAFHRRLVARAEDVAMIASFWNGFEAWLKFELALELARTTRQGAPRAGHHDHAAWNTIGLASKVALDDHTQLQLELRVSTPDEDRWLGIDLKVVFTGPSAGKQINAWRAGFETLNRIQDARCTGQVALLVAVGFSTAELARYRLDLHAPAQIVDATGTGSSYRPSVHLVTLARTAGAPNLPA